MKRSVARTLSIDYQSVSDANQRKRHQVKSNPNGHRGDVDSRVCGMQRRGGSRLRAGSLSNGLRSSKRLLVGALLATWAGKSTAGLCSKQESEHSVGCGKGWENHCRRTGTGMGEALLAVTMKARQTGINAQLRRKRLVLAARSARFIGWRE